MLAGDSVAVIDPGTDTIVGEVPVGGRPAGPAVGEGSVWVANRDDNTLVRIDPRSLDIVRRIGLRVAPIDVEVGAGSVWVLSDRALLRVDPAINDVVAIDNPPPRQWPGLVPSGGRRECGLRLQLLRPSGTRHPHQPRHEVSRLGTQKSRLDDRVRRRRAVGDHRLGADTLERIDPKTNAVVATISLARIGETHGWRYRMAVGEGAVWVSAPASLWRIDPVTARVTGSVQLGHSGEGSIATGDGAVWVANLEGIVLRIDSDSQTVAKTIPLGTLLYPADDWHGLAVGDGSVWVAVTSFAS